MVLYHFLFFNTKQSSLASSKMQTHFYHTCTNSSISNLGLRRIIFCNVNEQALHRPECLHCYCGAILGHIFSLKHPTYIFHQQSSIKESGRSIFGTLKSRKIMLVFSLGKMVFSFSYTTVLSHPKVQEAPITLLEQSLMKLCDSDILIQSLFECN